MEFSNQHILDVIGNVDRVIYNFGVPPLSEFEINFDLFSDPMMIRRFVATYAKFKDGRTGESVRKYQEIYDVMINESIKRNLFESTNILWDGFVYNSQQRSGVSQLITTIQYSDIKMVAKVMITFASEYHDGHFDGFPGVHLSEFMRLAKLNPCDGIMEFVEYVINLLSEGTVSRDNTNIIKLFDRYDPDRFRSMIKKYFSGSLTKGVR